MNENEKVEIECEKCEKLFSITIIEFEKTTEAHHLFLCPDCLAKAPDEFNEANKQPEKCFEHLIIAVNKMSDKYGKDGWKLVCVSNDRMYFERKLREV